MSLKAESELSAMSVAKDSRVESRGDRINFIIKMIIIRRRATLVSGPALSSLKLRLLPLSGDMRHMMSIV